MRQMVLHPSLSRVGAFGGELLLGKRKSARPVATRRPMHTTLRSEHAIGNRSFLMPHNSRVIRSLMKSLCSRFGIRVYEYSINSNHIHLLTLAKTRQGYKSFLRAFSGAVAMKMTGARKGTGLAKRFWAARPWSRIVAWGKAFLVARKYVMQNHFESIGVIPYTHRGVRRQGSHEEVPPEDLA